MPRLRPDQWAIVQHPAKVKVLAMGRRWGKTVTGGAVSLATASQGGHVAWIVPTYRNGNPLWRWVEATTAPLRKAGQARINQAERIVEFTSGGFLGIYSADSPDSVRGESFSLVILDEAARIAEETWTDAIQPTLADVEGDAILISTPKGHNWFWREWVRGRDGGEEVASFTAPSSANPSPQIRRAAALARERVSDRTYRQEWLAEFVEDGGSVFRRVSEAAIAPRQEMATPGHQYAFGVDWARSTDFTAIAVLDAGARQIVALDRFNQIDYQMQLGRLQALAARFRPEIVVAERNSMGDPLVERLQQMGLPVQPWLTTAASKQRMIDDLALAFEQGTLHVIDDPTLVSELQAYEATALPSGMLRYSAPEGLHDDTVIAVALAYQAIVEHPAESETLTYYEPVNIGSW